MVILSCECRPVLESIEAEVKLTYGTTCSELGCNIRLTDVEARLGSFHKGDRDGETGGCTGG